MSGEGLTANSRKLSEPFLYSAAFAYCTILALQLKLMWKIWEYKDLTIGDTATYMVQAIQFYERAKVTFAWSPLYTCFCGLLYHVSSDAWINILLQRLCISLTTAVLFLALLRKLLPPMLAWFIAAWWIVLPINFNALYELHQFAVIPILCAWNISLSRNKAFAKGCTIFVMWVTAALMRNELLIAAFLFTCISFASEFRKGIPRANLLSWLSPYVIALTLSLLVCVGAYIRSPEKGQALLDDFHGKHTINVSQIYAFSYSQRHPEWKGSPWSDCYQLSKETFGTPTPSMLEAFRANPKAMCDYFSWNVHLIPNGLQVLLFNATSGGDNPDYAPVNVASYPAFLSVIVVAIFALGLVTCWKSRNSLFQTYLKARIWCFTSMACVALTSVVIMLMQRPRPSYIFTFGMTLMFLTGFFSWRIFLTRGWKAPDKRVSVLLQILVLLFVPTFISTFKGEAFLSPTFVADVYHLIRPFASQIAAKNENLYCFTGGESLKYYLYGANADSLKLQFEDATQDFQDLNSLPFAAFISKHHIGWLVLDDLQLKKLPIFRDFKNGEAPVGWKLVASTGVPIHRLMLFERMTE
jgi:hypothetical protein